MVNHTLLGPLLLMPTVGNFDCEPIRIGIRCASYSTVLIRITSFLFAVTFVLVRKPIRMFWNVQNIRIGPANRSLFLLRRIASPNVVSIRVSSYWFLSHRCTFVSIRCGIRHLSAATQYVAIRCATIALSYWIAHVRIGSYKFLLVPIVFSSHHSAIVLILHPHRTASYCIVSPSCCSLLHLTVL